MFLTGGSRPLTRGKMFWNRDGRPLTTGVHPAKMFWTRGGRPLTTVSYTQKMFLTAKTIFFCLTWQAHTLYAIYKSFFILFDKKK